MRRKLAIFCLLVASTSGALNTRKAGWLDRVVQYRKDKFIEDLLRVLPPIEIEAKIEPAPPGFEDSKDWDFESVMRLLALLRQSKTGREVHRSLRRSMMAGPSRRIYMSFKDTYKYFPKIHFDNYYDDTDMESIELSFDSTPRAKVLDDNDVIVVSNPVESRLPSTRISVKMLKTILEERAFAARLMPPTTRAPLDWQPMNKTTKADDKTTKVDDGNATTAEAGDSTTLQSETEAVTANATLDDTTAETTTTEGGGEGRRRRSRPMKRSKKAPLQHKPVPPRADSKRPWKRSPQRPPRKALLRGDFNK